MKVFTALVRTEASDYYVYVFDKRPDWDELASMVHLDEGKCADLDFYKDTLSITIQEKEVIQL